MGELFGCSSDNIALHLKNIYADGELLQEATAIRATQFRQWCTFILRQYTLRGYVLDRKRMENGSFIGEDYFEHLLSEIREIRLSERRLYQKLTDIYLQNRCLPHK